MGTEQSRAWEARKAARRAEFDRQAQQFLEDSGHAEGRVRVRYVGED
jgi:hypothetical protein